MKPALWTLAAAACVVVVALLAAEHLLPSSHDAMPDAPDAVRRARLLAGGTDPVVLQGQPQLPRGPDGEPVLRGAVEVRVVNRHGDALPGVYVAAFPVPRAEDVARDGGRTDARGWVTMSDLPYDGTWRVLAGAAPVPLRAPAATTAWHPVLGPRMQITLDAVPLVLTLEDATDGRRLHGVVCGVKPRLRDGTWRSGDAQDLWIPLRPGRSASLTFDVTPPAGFVRFDEFPRSLDVSPAARRVQAFLPLRPESEVLVPLPDRRGGWDTRIMLDKRLLPNPEVHVDAFGRLRIGNIPHVPGADITVVVRREKERMWGTARLGAQPEDTPVVRLQSDLKGMPSLSWDARVQSTSLNLAVLVAKADAATPGQSFLVSSAASRAVLATLLERPVPRPPVARLVEVHVQRPDGTPAVGARVTFAGRTEIADARGRIRIPNVLARKHTLQVIGAGPSWTEVIEVTAGTRQIVRARAPRPVRVSLEVVDANDEPLPYATVAVVQSEALPWYDIEDGVQRIDPFTDARGKRVLHNLRAGKIDITASLGNRTGQATVMAEAGETLQVRIRLKRPASKKAKRGGLMLHRHGATRAALEALLRARESK